MSLCLLIEFRSTVYYFTCISNLILIFYQFLERGQFGDVKRARWNEKVVAVKFYSSQDRKGGFSEEVRYCVF